MNAAQPVIFKSAWTGLVLGLSCVLGGCDKVTYGQIAIEMQSAVDPACIQGAEQYLGATERFSRTKEEPGAAQFVVLRGGAAVGILAVQEPPLIKMAFGWMGRESDEVERASLRLLQDVHAAVMQSCNIQESSVKISTRCGTRHCDEWIR